MDKRRMTLAEEKTMNYSSSPRDENQQMKRENVKNTFVKLISGFAIVIALLLSTRNSAVADVVTLVPDGTVSAGIWSGVNAGNLGDGSNATMATIDGQNSTFTVSIENNPVYSGATINSVDLWVRANVLNGGSGQAERITIGSSQPTLDVSGNLNLPDDPAISDFTWNLASVTTATDVDALEINVATVQNFSAGEIAQVFDVWVVVDYTPTAASNQINSCSGCHAEPPIEAASRNATGAGEVVGSHANHSAYTCTVCHPNNVVFDHRASTTYPEGQIDLLSNIQGGTYSKGTAFAQANDVNGTSLGFCSDVTCHGGASSTSPQWGTTGGLDCTGCHQSPPLSNAHQAHFDAKGWTYPDTTGASCVNCHLDNASAHTDVTDGIIELDDAAMTPSGSGATVSCGSAPALGCHNGKATPQWGTTNIACTDCHLAGGTDPADPTTGLHDETPTVSGVIHNPSNSNFASCETCHTAAPSDNHWDGTFQNSAPIINFAASVNFADGTPPTCTATCHNENGTSGPWSRLWHENSDQTNGTQCAGCHGDWSNGWNAGVTHRTDADPQTIHGTGTNFDCKDCHALEAASGYTFTSGSGDWNLATGETSHHGNNQITMNVSNTNFLRGTGGNTGLSGCDPCHFPYDGTDGASNQHSFATTGWPLQTVSGDNINSGCDTCHGGNTTGSSKNNYWPDGANTLGDNTSPNNSGMHQKHMETFASYIYGENIAQLLTDNGNGTADAKQKNLCGYCHVVDPNDGDHGNSANLPAETDIKLLWSKAVDNNDAWNAGNGTCSNVDCHNSKATVGGTSGWYDGYTPGADGNCLVCHTVGAGGSNPTTGLHDVTPTVSGQQHDNTIAATGCRACHDDGTGSPSSGHWNGTFQPSAPTIQFTSAAGFTDGTPPTCSSNCHFEDINAGENWSRPWHENAAQTNGSECVGCHGDWSNGWNAGVTHRQDANPRSTHGTGTNFECKDCHGLESGGYTMGWNPNGAADHGDAKISMNTNGTSFARGTGGNLGKSGCSACHNAYDGITTPNHSFTTTNWATVGNISGEAISSDCTSCHGAGKSGQIVTSSSPHVITTRGGSFNACQDCHPGGLVGSQHTASGVVGIPNKAAVGINYVSGVSGGGVYSGYAGIVLGGDATSGSTEADICWNCHDANGDNVLSGANEPSEWGANTGGSYNYGNLGHKSWFAGASATWTSGSGFTYKNGRIDTPPGGQSRASTHDTKRAWPGTSSEAVGDVGCSYCHDVHDTLAGSPSGKPYLRGSWRPSPYPEDGAPRAGVTFTAGGNPYGVVPRGNTGTTGTGAYQIDQNNGNPNSGVGTTLAAYTSTDGLCQLCHDAATLVSQAPLHKNPVKYFSATYNDTSAARNIFKQSDRSAANTRFDPAMAYQGTTGLGDAAKGWMGGLRNKDFDSGIAVPPTVGGRYGYQAGTFEWGVTMNSTTVDADYHQFTCSKCHTPHASRLPRLMITNCLDTQNNTWDDQYASNANWSNWPNVTPGNNKQLSQSHSAQNCHRYTGEASGPGWNTVTPW